MRLRQRDLRQLELVVNEMETNENGIDITVDRVEFAFRGVVLHRGTEGYTRLSGNVTNEIEVTTTDRRITKAYTGQTVRIDDVDYKISRITPFTRHILVVAET